MKINYIETIEEWDKLIITGDLVVCDFTASWCGPCKRIAPDYKKLAEEFKMNGGNVVFVKIDVDENEETAEKCKISAMPTFQIWKNGNMIDKFEGCSGGVLDKIRKVVNDNI